MSSLCYQEVVVKRRENGITEDEFLEGIVKHCTGAHHGLNTLCNNDTMDPNVDRRDDTCYGHNIDDSFALHISLAKKCMRYGKNSDCSCEA